MACIHHLDGGIQRRTVHRILFKHWFKVFAVSTISGLMKMFAKQAKRFDIQFSNFSIVLIFARWAIPNWKRWIGELAGKALPRASTERVSSAMPERCLWYILTVLVVHVKFTHCERSGSILSGRCTVCSLHIGLRLSGSERRIYVEDSSVYFLAVFPVWIPPISTEQRIMYLALTKHPALNSQTRHFVEDVSRFTLMAASLVRTSSGSLS